MAKLLPIAVLVAGLIAFFALGLNEYLSFEMLKTHRQALVDWVARYGVLAMAVFGVAYAAMVACSIPGGAVATVVGGFLFGLIPSTIVVIVGATVGAVAVFLAARYAFYDYLHAKAGAALEKMERGFQENALSYLLFLRLVPVFPFFLVNLAAAFLGVRLGTYVLATGLGIIPGTFVYASLGNGLGAIFDAGQTPDLHIIFRWKILLPIIGLAVLALAPVVVRKLRR